MNLHCIGSKPTASAVGLHSLATSIEYQRYSRKSMSARGFEPPLSTPSRWCLLPIALHGQERGGNFWFLSPLFAFYGRFLHLTYHIRKQGSARDMPIAAIKGTKLFCGHWVSHCFLQVCFIYKTFFQKVKWRIPESNW